MSELVELVVWCMFILPINGNVTAKVICVKITLEMNFQWQDGLKWSKQCLCISINKFVLSWQIVVIFYLAIHVVSFMALWRTSIPVIVMSRGRPIDSQSETDILTTPFANVPKGQVQCPFSMVIVDLSVKSFNFELLWGVGTCLYINEVLKAALWW